MLTMTNTNMQTEREKRDYARLVQNKSGLARLLASENITVVHDPSFTTAAFELEKRVLILPVWENVSPELYDLLVGHEVGHALYTLPAEWIGAMDSLAQKHYGKSFKKALPFVKGILNILEDPRIERAMKRKYPGLRSAFAAGYMQLWEKDFFKVRAQIEIMAHNPAQTMAFGLMDRINLHCKVGARIGIYFTDEEAPFVARAESLETWAELVTLADDIIEYLRSKAKDQSKDETQKQGEKKPGKGDQQQGEKSKEKSDEKSETSEKTEDTDGEATEGEGSDGDDAEGEGSEGDAGDGEEAEDGEGKGKGAKSEAESEEDGEGAGGDDTAEGGLEEGEGEMSVSEPTDDIDRSKDEGQMEGKSSDYVETAEISEEDIAKELGDGATEKAFQENAKTLAETGVAMIRVTTPSFDYDAFVHDFKRVMKDHAADNAYLLKTQQGYTNHKGKMTNSFSVTYEAATNWVAKFRQTEKKNISYMLKEFDLKKAAASHAREQTGKTGRLDMGKLHSYQYNDDVFRRSVQQHKGQSHGMVFILDFSGSMSDSIQKVITSLMSMTMFCRQANIPFDVYIFTDALQEAGGGGGYTSQRNNKLEQTTNGWKLTDGSDIKLDGFWLRNLLSSRMNLREFNLALINLRLLALGKILSDRMGGTPLLSSIYVAREVLARFKTTHKLDVVTLMVMTDGDSNPVTDNKDGTLQKQMNAASGKPGYLTWHDKKTHRDRTEKFVALYQSDLTMLLQKMFLKDIKETLGANVIGYFIIPRDSYTYMVTKYETNYKNHTAIEKQFKEQGWAGVTAPGYDEFYMVGPRVLEANQERFTTSIGGADAAKDFQKYTAAKNNSRQILKSLVHRICKQGI